MYCKFCRERLGEMDHGFCGKELCISLERSTTKFLTMKGKPNLQVGDRLSGGASGDLSTTNGYHVVPGEPKEEKAAPAKEEDVHEELQLDPHLHL